MDDTKRQRWFSILFFLAILVLMAGLSSIVIRNLGSDRLRDWRGQATERQSAPPTRTPADIIVMHAEKPVTIGKSRIIYHGTKDGRILMDVYLLELDPQYPYRKRVEIDLARNGFRLAGMPVKATSISDSKLFLRHMP